MFPEIFQSLPTEKTKNILLIRHGEFDNPRQIVYNRDNVMKKEDLVHINEAGKLQMEKLGIIIKEKIINVKLIISSPEIRTLESAEELKKIFGLKKIEISCLLDDVYAPGPYFEKITMKEHEKNQGNVYNAYRWAKYKHETPKRIVERMQQIFDLTAKKLNLSESCILISHGDPIAWFANTIEHGKIPNPQNLRELIYPSKGNGIIYLLDKDNNIKNGYMLKANEENKIY